VNEITAALCGLCILLVPVAAGGIVLVNAGLDRSRNAAHLITSSLCAFSIAALAYFAIGSGIQGYPTLAAPAAMIGGKAWSWIGGGPFFLTGVKFDVLGPVPFAAWLQLATVGFAALIPIGGGSGRWRLVPICTVSAVFAAFIFPIFAHWVWGGGWLAQLGPNYGLGRGFTDVGGSGVIHCAAGFSALIVSWIMGPRQGKFGSEGMPLAIPGHNIVVVLFGCLLAMIGWIGLNGAGALLYAGAGINAIPLVAINTLLCAASAILAAAAVTRFRFGKPDASLSGNGWVSGLVASSASCAFVQPAEAVIIGLVAGVLTVFGIELLELRMGVDDPGGVVAVHGIGGLWGLLAMGLLGRSGHDEGQLVAQLIGIASLFGFVFPVTYGVHWLLNRKLPYRIPPEGEWQGLDLWELGAGAYPEFVAHGEEFMPR
jgi:Amt family ammonium transporter